jgi:hypothetical protein
MSDLKYYVLKLYFRFLTVMSGTFIYKYTHAHTHTHARTRTHTHTHIHIFCDHKKNNHKETKIF